MKNIIIVILVGLIACSKNNVPDNTPVWDGFVMDGSINLNGVPVNFQQGIVNIKNETTYQFGMYYLDNGVRRMVIATKAFLPLNDTTWLDSNYQNNALIYLSSIDGDAIFGSPFINDLSEPGFIYVEEMDRDTYNVSLNFILKPEYYLDSIFIMDSWETLIEVGGNFKLVR